MNVSGRYIHSQVLVEGRESCINKDVKTAALNTCSEQTIQKM